MAFYCRIVKSQRAATVLDGEGARLAGGRWNPLGVAIAYLSASRALAALEIFVHWGRQATELKWVVAAVEIPNRLIFTPEFHALPAGWNSLPSSPTARKFGADWAGSMSSLAIALPSAIVPEEKIVLLNVRHPDISKIEIAEIKPFQFDPRLGGE